MTTEIAAFLRELGIILLMESSIEPKKFRLIINDNYWKDVFSTDLLAVKGFLAVWLITI